MARYRYRAIDRAGNNLKGTLDAENPALAREQLRERGLLLRDLQETSGQHRTLMLKGETLLAFTLQLSQLVKAGLPLYESLVTIEEQYRNLPYHPLLVDLCEGVKRGKSLSESMAQHPRTFDKLYCSMIASGESSGSLSYVLDQLCLSLNKRERVKKQISTALIYPIILVIFAAGVTLLLLTFVLPSIEGIFEDQKLNSFTSFILSLSHLLRDSWWLYLPMVAAIGGIIFWQLRTPRGKALLERLLLITPFVKELKRDAALARFCRTMGTLLKGNVSIIESLEIASQVTGSEMFENDVKKASKGVLGGGSLSKELEQSSWFPPMLARMLAIGEESGSLSEMFAQSAEIYEEQLEKRINQFLALLQPLILVAMGVVIASIMIAILLPLSDLSSIGGE